MTPNNWNNYTVNAPQYMIRGFTMHEHLDEVGIINMNARLYDPVVGRFLQADNNIQDPDNLQNINRYGYALNNPLKYVDPSGNEYDYEGDYGDDYDNGPPTFERVLAEIFPFLVESAGRYTDNVEWIWEKWGGDSRNEAGVDDNEQVYNNFNDEMNYNMNEGSTDFNDEDNFSTGMGSITEGVNDILHSLYALNDDRTNDFNRSSNGYVPTAAETALILQYPGEAQIIKANSEIAFSAQTAIFKDYNGNDDIADAFRHAFFSALNASIIGYQLAKEFGEAHEMSVSNNKNSMMMDLFNNNIGFSIGISSKDKSAVGLLLNVFNTAISGGLIMLDYVNGGMNFVKTKP